MASYVTESRSARRGAWATIGLLLVSAIALWGVLCGLGWLLTHPWADSSFERWDGSVDRAFARHRTSTWNTVSHLLTYAAETATVVAIGAVVFVLLRVRLHRWRESLFLLAAVGGEVLIFVATTFVIDRHRPAVPHLDAAPPTSSFPSGHTAAATALYGALAIIAVRVGAARWLRRLLLILAVLLPVAVAFARMYRGMHYPTDTMGGAMLAISWLAITTRLVLPERA